MSKYSQRFKRHAHLILLTTDGETDTLGDDTASTKVKIGRFLRVVQFYSILVILKVFFKGGLKHLD